MNKYILYICLLFWWAYVFIPVQACLYACECAGAGACAQSLVFACECSISWTCANCADQTLTKSLEISIIPGYILHILCIPYIFTLYLIQACHSSLILFVITWYNDSWRWGEMSESSMSRLTDFFCDFYELKIMDPYLFLY